MKIILSVLTKMPSNKNAKNLTFWLLVLCVHLVISILPIVVNSQWTSKWKTLKIQLRWTESHQIGRRSLTHRSDHSFLGLKISRLVLTSWTCGKMTQANFLRSLSSIDLSIHRHSWLLSNRSTVVTRIKNWTRLSSRLMSSKRCSMKPTCQSAVKVHMSSVSK